MWYTEEEEEECNCNQGIINFKSIRFMINGSRIELRCRNCNRMVGGAYFHRKDYATKTNMVERRTQSNALTQANSFREQI